MINGEHTPKVEVLYKKIKFSKNIIAQKPYPYFLFSRLKIFMKLHVKKRNLIHTYTRGKMFEAE